MDTYSTIWDFKYADFNPPVIGWLYDIVVFIRIVKFICGPAGWRPYCTVVLKPLHGMKYPQSPISDTPTSGLAVLLSTNELMS